MDLHIPDLREIANLLAQFPILMVLLGGMVVGNGFTQIIKKTYLAFRPLGGHDVTDARYRISIRWLAAISTYGFTLWLWHGLLKAEGPAEVVSIGTAFASPLLYDVLRALVGWKFPEFAKRWGTDPDKPDLEIPDDPNHPHP